MNRETRLKVVSDEDAEQLFRLVDSNRAHLRPWMPWVDTTHSTEAISSFIDDATRQNANNDGFHCVILCGNEIVGVVGLHRIDVANKTTSIGYWLGADFQGNGIMTAACAALIDHLFFEFDLNRVEIRCAEANHKSQRVPQRLGFTKEGLLCEAEWLHDHFSNSFLFSCLKSKWIKRK